MSIDRDSLADRMKRYERVTQTVLPRRTYTLIRVDGRAFHSYLRDADRPYDYQFMADMDVVAQALCAEVSGTVFAYTQSDEISLLVVDFQGANTQPWFGGEVQKIVSTSAAVATAALCARRPGKPATFDARVFTISDPVEVANYFLWRQRDAVRNSITMAAQAQFSHQRLHGVNTRQMQELLWAEKQINWNDYPVGAKRGRVVVKASGEREVTFVHRRTQQPQTVSAMRSWWEVRDAPHFVLNAGTWLPQSIPAMPPFAGVLPAASALG
ncbi:tRNA(His) guanylyltransferase Thg1 family protein [Micromonospora sp. NPDC049559]|uniref:tRNA(His) guanylyltransferase Thg1 family protein n=1 Tax=Micromonospora sp. NPDC049559 TaxID=3155923 RepID=UPI003434671D